MSSKNALHSDSSCGRSDDLWPIHPEFRIIALANRPGFPFLGNDFFAEMGDIFAVTAVRNPDKDSEIQMLRAYAPDVEVGLISSLASAFADLRGLSEQGMLSYPYSTREVPICHICKLFSHDNQIL